MHNMGGRRTGQEIERQRVRETERKCEGAEMKMQKNNVTFPHTPITDVGKRVRHEKQTQEFLNQLLEIMHLIKLPVAS